MQSYTVIYILLVTVVMKVSCDCGVITPRESSSISPRDGSEEEIFPWHVIIHRNLTGSRIHHLLCAGTLISPDVVITTAACYQGIHDWKIFDVSTLMVVAGKYYQPYSWPDSGVQQTRVKTIYVARGYNGTNIYKKNIAWLILENPFNITPLVNPVCVDFEKERHTEDIQTGQIVKGMHQKVLENDFPKTKLVGLQLSVFSHIDCNSILVTKNMWTNNLMTDTFCAERKRNTFPFYGTGFCVQREGRWYLSAVYTSTVKNKETAGDYSLRLLTNVRDYIDEMNRNSDIRKCGIAGPPANSLIVDGLRAERGGFPWHVAVYEKNLIGTYDQICSGSIISFNIVVSAAHCFYDSNRRHKLDASNFAVAAGKQYRLYNWPERFVQKSAIETIHIPDRYYGLDGLYAEDIAWLILERTLNVSMSVRPICIDGDDTRERQHLQSGSVGKVAGWGLTANGSASLELQEMNVPFVPHEECVSTLPRDFIPFLTSDKICGGYSNGTSLCDGDSGGGLAFKREGRWYLRGIVSAAPRSGGTCDSHAYTAFTNVGRFMDELYRFTNLTAHDFI